jgi:hypothetical protein
VHCLQVFPQLTNLRLQIPNITSQLALPLLHSDSIHLPLLVDKFNPFSRVLIYPVNLHLHVPHSPFVLLLDFGELVVLGLCTEGLVP